MAEDLPHRLEANIPQKFLLNHRIRKFIIFNVFRNTKDNNMSSPDPSSKKDNQRNTKKDIKKDKKPENQ